MCGEATAHVLTCAGVRPGRDSGGVLSRLSRGGWTAAAEWGGPARQLPCGPVTPKCTLVDLVQPSITGSRPTFAAAHQVAGYHGDPGSAGAGRSRSCWQSQAALAWPATL